MTLNEIVTDPNLATVLNASRDTRLHAIALVDQIAAANPSETSSAETQLEISKQQKLLITNLAQLRGLHRAAYMGARQTKHETADARQEVDRLHLQLQNLYYEQRHLQGEITACDSYELVFTTSPINPSIPASATSSDIPLPGQFNYDLTASQLAQELIGIQNSHTYQQLPLITVEAFLAIKPEHANDDENALMVARIEHERSEREGLEHQRMELLKRKAKLVSDNKKRKDDLANLDNELEKFIDAAKPIQKLFEKNIAT